MPGVIFPLFQRYSPNLTIASPWNNVESMVQQPAIQNPKDYLKTLPKTDVLVCVAHPDDDTFFSGTLALMAQKGLKVQMVYATSGDGGFDASSLLAYLNQPYPETRLQGAALAAVRESESIQSLSRLGITRMPVFLRHPDGETRNPEVFENIRKDIQTVVETTQPKLILTFGADGITNHRDHKNIGSITDGVVSQLSNKSRPRVFHLAYDAESISKFNQAMAQGGEELWAWTNMQPTPDPVRWVIPYTADVQLRKSAALKCYETQFSPREQHNFNLFSIAHPYEKYSELKPDEQPLFKRYSNKLSEKVNLVIEREKKLS